MLRDLLKIDDVGDEYDKILIFDLSENDRRSDFTKYLASLIHRSYRDIDYVIQNFKDNTKEELFEYLNEEVFPEGEEQLVKNVKKGDWGEILTTNIIEKYEKDMTVPFNKIMWKLNRQKSMFCTDVFAHNKGDKISRLKYYEVKTYSTKKKDLGVIAHNSLLKDSKSGQQAIADMISRSHFEKGKLLKALGHQEDADDLFRKSKEYNLIVQNPNSYEQEYEIVLIRERKNFSEDELERLNSLPPEFDPMYVTLLLIDNLDELINKSFELAYEKIWDTVNES